MDSTKPCASPEPPLLEEASRLKAFAVLAFYANDLAAAPPGAAIDTRECAAHATPSRFTMAAHILLFRPLVSVAVAAASAALSALWLGRLWHSLLSSHAYDVGGSGQ